MKNLPGTLLKIFIKEVKNYFKASIWPSAKIVAFHLFDFGARIFTCFGALVLEAVTFFISNFVQSLNPSFH